MTLHDLYANSSIGTRLDELFEDLADGTNAGEALFLNHILTRLTQETVSLLADIRDTVRYCERYEGFEPTIKHLNDKKKRYERLLKRISQATKDLHKQYNV